MTKSSIRYKSVRTAGFWVVAFWASVLGALEDSWASEEAKPTEALTAPAVLQTYVVETGRLSEGRLFLAPTEPREGVSAGVGLAVRGALLSRTTTGSRRLTFDVTAPSGEKVQSVDLTVEVEPGSIPFGFDWPMNAAIEGDYVARLVVLDPVLGEDARVEWRVSLRDPAAVAARVDAARKEVERTRDTAGDTMPAAARQALTLALESLAVFPAQDRPLIEADENAAFAMTTASHVRAGLTFGRFAEPAQPIAEPSPDTENAFAPGSPLRGAVVLSAGANAGARAASLGFDFLPWVSPVDASSSAGHLPVMVWLQDTDDSTRARSAEELQRVKEAGHVSLVSLWTAPRAPAHDAETLTQFRRYVEEIYGDRTKMNRAWKQHLFSFDEVEFWPGVDNRAYQYDVQSFERQRTSQWISDGIRQAQELIAPAAATITFTDGVLTPGEARLGLDAETLAPTLAVVAVRSAGPLDDARYAQRYPAANILYAMFRSFAPDRPLVALQSLDYDLNDRLRMNSAAQVRTLAVEAAIEGVSTLVIETPAFADAVQGAPEAVGGFADALREIRGAREAIAALHADPVPVAILWSDSSKILDGGAAHLTALTNAYEGCSFSGQNVGFITERQLASGQWSGVRVLVLPNVSALTNEAFEGIESLIASGAAVIRTESGPVYDEHGRALGRTLNSSVNSILVRGKGESSEYLDSVDELMSRGVLPDPLRVITRNGFPIEGVKTRYAKGAGGEYLYVVNLRKEPVACRLNREIGPATDVFTSRVVEFPRTIDPLDPVLLRIEPAPSVP